MVFQSADSKAPSLELKTVEMLESTLEHKKERKKVLMWEHWCWVW
jgi:hypothetical protein